jgi:ABC-2 type transport system permease protein
VTVSRSVSVALAVSERNGRRVIKQPARVLPPILIPLLTFTAFTGALSAVANTKGFKYYDYTAFQFVFLLYMASILVGVFISFEIAHDFESGFGARLMVAAPKRLAIVAGYVVISLARCLLAIVVVWAVVLAVGMSVRGGPLELAGLTLLALLLNVATTLYGTGVALRMQSTAAGALVFIPVFMVLFLTPIFAPRSSLSGWLKTAAGVNPLTPTLEAGRGFLADDPVRVAAAFGSAVGLVLVFGVWAVLGMRKAERGPGRKRRRLRKRSATRRGS